MTEDMSTDAVAARVRKALEDNQDWTGAWGSDCGDVIDSLVADITVAVTGDHPPVEVETLPDPVLLRTFPVRVSSGGGVTEYSARFEVQFQMIEIRAVVASHARLPRPPEVQCYRVGNRLDVRMVADDGTVYAQVSRLLDGGW